MASPQPPEVPQTLEGWYVLHDVYAVDWPSLNAAGSSEREELAADAVRWLEDVAAPDQGDTAAYSVLTQKGDLMFVHYRPDPEALRAAELDLQHTRLIDYLQPAYSYFSVIEVGLYELTAIARRRLAEQELSPGSDEYEQAMAGEMEAQKKRVQTRLFPRVPPSRYICFYPMSKRRGEQHNWYALSIDQRRDMMRGHGRVGRKYHEQVTQVIGGSTGLDDWEWGVSLHADDALVFKKLVYEMRFDAASALYAEFGPFYIGIRQSADGLRAMLVGD
jgi:chlorite dismutase